jgi:hypothetical protein
MTLDYVQTLTWPKNAKEIGSLSLQDFQSWYLSQPMQDMVHVGQIPAFKRFVWRHYTIKVKLLRLYYRIKRLCLISQHNLK